MTAADMQWRASDHARYILIADEPDLPDPMHFSGVGAHRNSLLPSHKQMAAIFIERQDLTTNMLLTLLSLMFMLLAVTQAVPDAVQVCLHACAELIANVPFFEDAEEGFVTSLVTLLHPQVCLHERCSCHLRTWQCQCSSQLCDTCSTTLCAVTHSLSRAAESHASLQTCRHVGLLSGSVSLKRFANVCLCALCRFI